MNKLVIIGWGRMGMTHASIINGLYPNKFEVIIVEPNKRIRLLTRASLGYKVVSDVSKVTLSDALVLITTPPFLHRQLTNVVLSQGVKSVFVEKPFGLHDKIVENNSKISVGYVLRFTEVAQKLKKLINEEGCIGITLDYSSNTLTKPPKGWRNSKYGGVLNEMGSHLIDLLMYLTDAHDFRIQESKIMSVISDVDDIVSVKGLIGGALFELNLNWVNKNYRKPVWSGVIETTKQKVNFDQQSIDGGFIPNEVDYYVRGREFSMQMQHFIESDKSITCSSSQANLVHKIISTIKSKK